MEYLILLFEFYKTNKRKYTLVILFLPLLLALSVYFFTTQEIFIKVATALQGNIVTVLGILVGFSISMFTILLTSGNSSVLAAKEYFTEFTLYQKKVSLFKLVLINLGYIVILEGSLLIINLIYPIFISNDSSLGRAIFSLNLAFLIHVILVTLRTILDFYFIVTRNEIKTK